MAVKRKRLTNEERKEESRKGLLEAGAEGLEKALAERSIRALRVQDVCADAGYSTGAFYAHWESVEDYQEALSRHLLKLDTGGIERSAADLMKETKKIIDENDDRLAAVKGVAEQDFKELVDNKHWPAVERFLVNWGRAHYKKEAAASYKLADASSEAVYGYLLDQMGREPREPFTDLKPVATLLLALIEGLWARHKVDPKALAIDGEGKYSLYSLGVASLLATFTKPREGAPDDRDIDDVLRELLASETHV
ncbi:hypothetical protein DSM112329_00193 [Paraconexibacter sp. AEG42_29]|uniref:HTH tetR-type domain-containing protein n=1 Tax=Paraconexibacter sp. AEG42_29 TaxID=2997339 RepID=A0AAU7AP06_9ACTN